MFTQTLYAQGEAAGGLGGMMPSLLMMAAIFAIFYFLLIRPQRVQQKKLQAAINALKKGDKVVLQGGILAEYVSEKEAGKTAIVKLNDDTKIEILKSAVASVVMDTALPAGDAKKAKPKKEEKNKIKEELEKAEKAEEKNKK